MRKKIMTAAGIAIFAFALATNLQYSLNNYGINGGNLEMLKAFATTGTDTSQKWDSTYPTCTIIVKDEIEVTVAGVTTKTTIETPYQGSYRTCVEGWGFCITNDPECEINRIL